MVYTGTSVCGGVAVAPVLLYAPAQLTVSDTVLSPEEIAPELERYEQARGQAIAEVDALLSGFDDTLRDQGKIFAAHRELLEDEEIVAAVRAAIAEERKNCAWAVDSVCRMYAGLFEQLEDPLLRERAADIRDVSARLLRACLGITQVSLSHLPQPCILVAHDLLPSDTAALDREKVLGIVTEVGGATCHSAIIARSYDIPAVLGVAHITQQVSNGETVILNATQGEVLLSPSADQLKEFQSRREAYLTRRTQTALWRDKPCRTKDGVEIAIGINVADPTPGELDALHAAADFVGLFRTEFLYMGAHCLPTEEEQFRKYKALLLAAENKAVTLRTLDIGADKTLSYYPMPREDNPALGLRALRLCLKDGDLFRTQLRAALRSSVYGQLQLMFPMVGGVEDFLAAKAVVDEVKEELRQEAIPFREDLPLGIMIEIPSAALMADALAAHADFASIGTNDLSQYTLAADRMNPEVALYCRPLHPAVFRLIRMAVNAFQSAGKPISVCGEMGGDPLSACVLAGLGMRKLSMSLSRIPEVKMTLAQHTLPELESLAHAACSLSTGREVLDCLTGRLS